tara:strand:- start:559 stop:861 length:303 start_codon:yes stop_codon:yes gene_type:complete
MKSYIWGFISGSIFILAFVALVGMQKPTVKKPSKTYKMKIIELENRLGMIEGIIKERFKLVGENFMYLEGKTQIPIDQEYLLNNQLLIEDPYHFQNSLKK